jgi:DNA-binding NarL/FixJ family response regulator
VQGGDVAHVSTEARLPEPPLLERDSELALINDKLDQLVSTGHGEPLLIEGPAGIGKTRLLEELGRRANEREIRVLTARGSDMERDYGYGLVRQLFGRTLISLDPKLREDLLSGAARLAAGVFGLGEDKELRATAGEESMYGLYWLVEGLVQDGPILLSIDDAHWGDSASLRFLSYLCRRLAGLPVLVSLAARPAEPGSHSSLIGELVDQVGASRIQPSPLGPESAARIIEARLGRTDPDLERACLNATGGNPLLINEFISQVGAEGEGVEPGWRANSERARLGASIVARATKLDLRAPDVVRAVAILGTRANVNAIAEMRQLDPGLVSELVDGLVAAQIFAPGTVVSFAHPLLRESVLADEPESERDAEHGRAAETLRRLDADIEEIASHLVLCRQASGPEVVNDLYTAAREAEGRGALDSVITYLRRALEGPVPPQLRATLLKRLGSAELVLRDPAGFSHLADALQSVDDPSEGVAIARHLTDALAMAGMWDEGFEIVEQTFERFGGSPGPHVLELEGLRTGLRGYDPRFSDAFDADLPRLRALVEKHPGQESSLLRWLLAGIGSVRMAPRETVLELSNLEPEAATFLHGEGTESSFVLQAAYALLVIDQFDRCEEIKRALIKDAQTRGSLGALLGALTYAAAVAERQGDLRAVEADLRTAVDLVETTDLNLMLFTTAAMFCVEAITERSGLADVAGMMDALALPPAFAETTSGGMLLETRGYIRLSRGRRSEAVEDFRGAGAILDRMNAGPRVSRWRTRLALALPGDSRQEGLALAKEELALARQLGSARSEGIALRALGELEGGSAGLASLEASVATLSEHPSPLESARSLAALGSLLRRENRRASGREHLRRALDLANRAGAERLEARVTDELRLAGGRLHRRHLSGAESLTPAELRVATAAAAGATNREIAQDLFLALRTVETHLTSAYQKLSISSRSQLAQALDTSRPAGARPSAGNQ